MFDLVEVATKDKLRLQGLYSSGKANKPAVIHFHGFQGDFFTNPFIRPVAKKLHENGYGFLSIQTRGMGNDYLFNTTDGTWKRYGSYFEVHEEARLDIDAWIEFLKEKGYKQIILQGHSLGTFKIVRYLFEGTYPEIVNKLILLAPFDNIYMAESYTKGKWKDYVKQAKQMVQEGKGEEIIPKHWWDITISINTYISWLDENDFTHMFNFYDKKYLYPVLNKLNIPVKVIVGSKDEYLHTSNPSNPREAIDIMKKNIENFSYKLIEDAKHSFTGYEDVLAREILEFIKQ